MVARRLTAFRGGDCCAEQFKGRGDKFYGAEPASLFWHLVLANHQRPAHLDSACLQIHILNRQGDQLGER